MESSCREGICPGSEHTKWYQDDSVRNADVYPGDRATQQELDRIMELKALADKHNLEIPMISNYFDFIAGKQRWEESIVIASRYIEYAQAMGVRLIRTMTGGYGEVGFKSPWDRCSGRNGFISEIILRSETNVSFLFFG